MRVSLGVGLGDLSVPSGLDISKFNTTPTKTYDYSGDGTSRLREGSFKPDGTKLIAINQSNDKIFEYSMSTAWAISTLSKVREVDISSIEGNPQAMHVSYDGNKIYFSGFIGDTIRQYTIDNWSLSTFTSDGKTYQPVGSNNFIAFTMNKAVDRLFMVNANILPLGQVFSQFNFSTPGDISTGSDPSKSFDFSATPCEGPGPAWLSDNGKEYVVSGLTPDNLYQFEFVTAGDISTLIDKGKVFDYSTDTGETHISGCFVTPDYSKIILIGGTTTFIYQFER